MDRYRLLPSSKFLLQILLCACFWPMLGSCVGFWAMFRTCRALIDAILSIIELCVPILDCVKSMVDVGQAC